jgi:hypothetical protein
MSKWILCYILQWHKYRETGRDMVKNDVCVTCCRCGQKAIIKIPEWVVRRRR